MDIASVITFFVANKKLSASRFVFMRRKMSGFSTRLMKYADAINADGDHGLDLNLGISAPSRGTMEILEPSQFLADPGNLHHGSSLRVIIGNIVLISFLFQLYSLAPRFYKRRRRLLIICNFRWFLYSLKMLLRLKTLLQPRPIHLLNVYQLHQDILLLGLVYILVSFLAW